MHRSYWGFFDRENESVKVEISEEKHLENLLARRVSKRRELSNVLAPEYFVSHTEYLIRLFITKQTGRAMRRAAAAAAVERAHQARIQRGQVNKGGGGKGGGKGAAEREETCISCHVEFTVGGDGGVAFQCPGSHYMVRFEFSLASRDLPTCVHFSHFYLTPPPAFYPALPVQ